MNKKIVLFIFLFSCLFFSFIPFVSSQGTWEEYLETLEPIWENDFDAGDWSGFTAHGASCSLVTDFVNGGYFMRVNTSTTSSATYVTPSPAINVSAFSLVFDFYVVEPDVDNGGTLWCMIGYSHPPSGAAANMEFYYNSESLHFGAHDEFVHTISHAWHHVTYTESVTTDGSRSITFLDNNLVLDWDNPLYATVGYFVNFYFGVSYNIGSKSLDIYLDNLKVYDEAPLIDAPLPTSTPSPSPQPVSDEYPNVDPFVAVPSYYMVLLVLFAVVAVLAGLYVTFEREGENKGVALMFVLVGLVLFVVLIVGYFVGF